jgi:hypothetical protein
MVKRGNKEALQIASNFIKGNITLSLGALAVLITIALLKMAPLIGVIFAFVYPILSFAIQIYVAREVPSLQRPEDMAKVAQRTRLGDLLSRHLDIAAGGFLGFFLILMLFGVLFTVVMGFSIDIQTLQSGNMEAISAAIYTSGALVSLLLFLMIGLWLSYLMPGVMGEVVMAENFADAFRKSFLLFSPSFWKRTFSKAYFVLILIWSMIVFVAALLFSWIAVSIILLPFALIGVYYLSLYNAVIYVFAREALADK